MEIVMKEIIFPAKELLNYDLETLRNALTGEFYLEFEDGVLKTNDRETILTLVLWQWIKDRPIELFQRHHISKVIEKRALHVNTHMQLLNTIHWDIYETYKTKGRFKDTQLLEELVEEMYVHGNNFYNYLSIWMEEEVATVSIRDVIDLFNVKEIDEVLSTVEPKDSSILETTKAITQLIAKSDIKSIKENNSVRLARSGVIKTDQLVQALAPTGYIEDLGGEIFKKPLLSNYTDGHRNLYDLMVESRKASLSIEATKSDLEIASYQSRKLELLNESIMAVHPGDCGTKGYIPYRIRKVNGLTRSDLELLEGKYYYLPDDPDKTLHELKRTDDHLIGRIINLRTITHCAHPDPNGVCETCLGAMALTIPNKTNLGHLVTTDLYAFIIQRQLSKKHFLSNTVGKKIELREEDKKYVRLGRDGISYFFTDELKGKPFKITIGSEDGNDLVDVVYMDNLDKVSLNRVSQLGDVTIEIDYGAYVDTKPAILGDNKRKASFTTFALKHIKENKDWTVDAKGRFTIDMTGWDVKQPFAVVPMKADSLADFIKEFKNQVESDAKNEDIRDIAIDPDDFLLDIFGLVNSELSLNFAQIEAVVYGIMIRDAAEKRMELPKPWSKKGIGIMMRAMDLRSLSSSMAYENHVKIFSSMKSFIVRNRLNHPFDKLLM